MADRMEQQLGNYRLVRLIGQGGFGEVYLGEHIYLKTQAAIKLLQVRLAKEDIESFLHEARTIAGLKHTHIVRVLDFGIDGDTPFLVMDYASHGTLRQRYPKGTHLPLTSIVSYVKQVADALQYAHDKKLVHRDIKPENMLLGENDEVLLSDFGIALIAQTSRSQSVQDVAGTASYMAPEQFQGKPRPASDQYALAVIVYEWLTGARPFHGSFSEIASQHLFMSPPPLQGRTSTASPAVEQVVMTALAKDSKQRFASVQAFANALGQAYLTVPPQRGTHTSELPIPNQPLLPTQTAAASLHEHSSSTSVIPPSQSNYGVVSQSHSLKPSISSVPLGQYPLHTRGDLPPNGLFRQRLQRRLPRRTLLLGLVGLTGIGIATGGIIWLTHPQGSLNSNGKAEPTATVGPTTPTTPPKPTSISNPVGYYSDASGKLTIGIFREVAAQPQQHFTDFPVEVDSDMVVIGGGGRGDDSPPGALLTASYPREDMAAWLVSSKAHLHPDPHRLVGFAIGLRIAGMPRDELLSNHDIAVFSIDSKTAPHPEATVNIPSDFVLLGGGFNVHWQGAGNLATASFPGPTNSWTSWTARSKDHEVADPSFLTTYAIGLRRNLSIGTVMLHVNLSQSGIAAHPTSTASRK